MSEGERSERFEVDRDGWRDVLSMSELPLRIQTSWVRLEEGVRQQNQRGDVNSNRPKRRVIELLTHCHELRP